jgi:hypothetical protein
MDPLVPFVPSWSHSLLNGEGEGTKSTKGGDAAMPRHPSGF